MGSIGREQRFTRRNPCPICGGGGDDRRGRGIRCSGYLSEDEEWAFCTREEYAGQLRPNERTSPATYRHRLHGRCGCGDEHNAAEGPTRPAPEHAQWMRPKAEAPPAQTRTHRTVRPERIHVYHNADGSPRLRVLRIGSGKDKRFIQQRPDGAGDWLDGLDGLAPVLYRLPELLAAPALQRPVFIVEGEKCVEALAAVGLVATCSAMGAKKWELTDEASRHDALRDRHVVILPDHDEPGRQHAEMVAADLLGVAKAVRVVELPGLPEKGDIVDWLAAGHTKDELYELVILTPAQPITAEADVPADAAARIHELEQRVRECEQREAREQRQAEARRVWDIPHEVLDPLEKRALTTVVEMCHGAESRGEINEDGEVHLSVGYVRRRDTGEIVGPGIEGTSKIRYRTLVRALDRLETIGFISVRRERKHGPDGKIESSANYYRFDRELIVHPERAKAVMTTHDVAPHDRGGNRRTCPRCWSERVKVERKVTVYCCEDCQHTWTEIKGGEDEAQQNPDSMGTSPICQTGTSVDTDRDREIVCQTGTSVETAAEAAFLPPSIPLQQLCATCNSTRTYRFADDAPEQVRCWECDPRPLHMDPPAPTVGAARNAGNAGNAGDTSCEHPPHARVTLRDGAPRCGHCLAIVAAPVQEAG